LLAFLLPTYHPPYWLENTTAEPFSPIGLTSQKGFQCVLCCQTASPSRCRVRLLPLPQPLRRAPTPWQLTVELAAAGSRVSRPSPPTSPPHASRFFAHPPLPGQLIHSCYSQSPSLHCALLMLASSRVDPPVGTFLP
jgi:hypothetical protein